MMLSLHKNATTTPAIRARIAASDEPAAVLAARYGVTLDTMDLSRFRSGLLRAILAIKETGYGSNTRAASSSVMRFASRRVRRIRKPSGGSFSLRTA